MTLADAALIAMRWAEEATKDLAPRQSFIMSRRYCPMCDKWLPSRETVCKACGMPTEKAAKAAK